MSRHWYGDAQSARTNVRRVNGQRTLQRVSGMSNTVRAIYGSTDRATADHGNDPLCVVVDGSRLHPTIYPGLVAPSYSPPTGEYVGRYAELNSHSHIMPTQSNSAPVYELQALLDRAAHKGMTLVEYASFIGITL